MTRFVYLHGFASGPNSAKAAAFADAFRERGIPLRVPDLEGGDFENLTISSQLAVARKCLDERPAGRFGLIGSSLGGYLAALLAQSRPDVAAVYLMAPAFGFLKRWLTRFGIGGGAKNAFPDLIPVFNFRYNETRMLSARIFEDARSYEKESFSRVLPVRIVHGLHDDVVDIAVSREFVLARSWCQLVELDSDHGLLSHVDWLVNDALAFFRDAGLLESANARKVGGDRGSQKDRIDRG